MPIPSADDAAYTATVVEEPVVNLLPAYTTVDNMFPSLPRLRGNLILVEVSEFVTGAPTSTVEYVRIADVTTGTLGTPFSLQGSLAPVDWEIIINGVTSVLEWISDSRFVVAGSCYDDSSDALCVGLYEVQGDLSVTQIAVWNQVVTTMGTTPSTLFRDLNSAAYHPDLGVVRFGADVPSPSNYLTYWFDVTIGPSSLTRGAIQSVSTPPLDAIPEGYAVTKYGEFHALGGTLWLNTWSQRDSRILASSYVQSGGTVVPLSEPAENVHHVVNVEQPSFSQRWGVESPDGAMVGLPVELTWSVESTSHPWPVTNRTVTLYNVGLSSSSVTATWDLPELPFDTDTDIGFNWTRGLWHQEKYFAMPHFYDDSVTTVARLLGVDVFGDSPQVGLIHRETLNETFDIVGLNESGQPLVWVGAINLGVFTSYSLHVVTMNISTEIQGEHTLSRVRFARARRT